MIRKLVKWGTPLTAAAFLCLTPAYALDADAAKALAVNNGCGKCHDPGKEDAPDFKEIAGKYRNEAKIEAKLVKHLTSGDPVKFPDGHEEDHKIVRTKPAEDKAQIKNLVEWVLSH